MKKNSPNVLCCCTWGGLTRKHQSQAPENTNKFIVVEWFLTIDFHNIGSWAMMITSNNWEINYVPIILFCRYSLTCIAEKYYIIAFNDGVWLLPCFLIVFLRNAVFRYRANPAKTDQRKSYNVYLKGVHISKTMFCNAMGTNILKSREGWVAKSERNGWLSSRGMGG